MKVYLVYLKVAKKIFDERIKYLIDNHLEFNYDDRENVYIGLYAWTTKKKVLKEFMEERNRKVFVVKKEDMEDEEYDEFTSVYNLEKLEKYELMISNIKNNKENIKLYLTKNEYLQVTEYLPQNLYEFSNKPIIDYMFFTKSMVILLDIISYTTNYDLCRSHTIPLDRYDEIHSRMEVASYNSSHGYTVYGFSQYQPFEDGGEFTALIYLFESIFVQGEI